MTQPDVSRSDPPPDPAPAAPAVSPARPPRAFRAVLIVAVLMSLAPFTMDMYLPALPRLASDLAATNSQVQLTLTGVLLGLAFGQLMIGPMADSLGRKRPIVIGLSMHLLASGLCAIAPSIWVLSSARVLQGLACAATSVVAMATVRDLHGGIHYARVMSRMFLVIGIAPVIAPSLGAAVLTFTGWRGIFVVLAGVGVLLLLLAVVGLQETLTAERRRPAGLRDKVSTYRLLLRDRYYLCLIVVGGLMFACLFSYVAGASFVLQEQFGLTSSQYALVLVANGVGLTATAQVNPALISRYGPANVLTAAILTGVVATGALLVLILTGTGGLPAILLVLGVCVGAYGVSMPNSQALAMNRHGATAGTAAALMGATQFLLGGIVAPLVGLGDSDGVAMAAAMLAATTGAALLMLAVVRRDPATMAVR